MPKTAIAYLAGIGSLMAMLLVGFTAGLMLTGSGSEKIGPTRLDRARAPARTASIDPSSLRSIPQPIEVQTPATEAKAQDVIEQSAFNNLSAASIDAKVGAAVPDVQNDLNDLNGASSKVSIATNGFKKADAITNRNLIQPLPAERTLSAIGISKNSSNSGAVNQADNVPSPKTQKTNRLEKMILRTIELPDGRRITQLLPFTRKREAKLTTN